MNLLRVIAQLFILKLLLIHAVSKYCKIISLEDGDIIYEYDDESEPIGLGEYGKVFKGIKKHGNLTEDVAFKVIKIGGLNTNLEDEGKIYEKVSPHDSIPRIYHPRQTEPRQTEPRQTEQKICFPETNGTKNNVFVTELVGETLKSLFKKYKRFSTITVLRVGLQMLDVIEHMHRQGVVHRDVHYANIAVGWRNNSKIFLFDFGLSTITDFEDFVIDGQDIRRLDLGRLSHMLTETANLDTFLHYFGFTTEDEISFNETLKKFKELSENPIAEKPDYEGLRELLRAELEKHKNTPNYDKFDWQRQNMNRDRT